MQSIPVKPMYFIITYQVVDLPASKPGLAIVHYQINESRIVLLMRVELT